MDGGVTIVTALLIASASVLGFAMLFALFSLGTIFGATGRSIAHTLAALAFAALLVGGFGILVTPASGLGVFAILLSAPLMLCWLLAAKLTRSGRHGAPTPPPCLPQKS